MKPSIIVDDFFPSDLRGLAVITLILALLALVIGFPLFLFNFNLPPIENVEFDTFEHMELSFRYLFRFLGVVGTLIGGYALISSLLTLRRSRLGWIMLFFLYLGGTLGCLLLILLYFQLLLRYSSLPLPSFPLAGLIFGILGIGVLVRKRNISFLFSNSSLYS